MKAPNVAIVDYQISNLFSVAQACGHVGLNGIITSDAAEIKNSDAVILPGVGAFGDAMKNLDSLGLVEVLRNYPTTGRPFMGICLGLQLLFSHSDEYGTHHGLNIVPGRVRRIPSKINGSSVRVPQIAWNRIVTTKDHPILQGVENNDFMYFVHSYFVAPLDNEAVLTTTNYEGLEYCSSVATDNIVAFQFHPEKSGPSGLRIYSNFRSIITGDSDGL